MAQATRDAEGFVQSISNIPENEDFVVYGTIHAHPESADALEAVYAETTRLAQHEPGTVYYCICRVSLLHLHSRRSWLTRNQDQDDRAMFHMFERYKGKAAFDAHNQQPTDFPNIGLISNTLRCTQQWASRPERKRPASIPRTEPLLVRRRYGCAP
jgi:quinol monooxygenase YgiN